MAGGIITTGAAPKALWPGIYEWWGTNYDKHPMLYPELFDIKVSDKAYEETPELVGFGLAPIKAQGTSTQFDSWRQSFVTRYTNTAYGLGFIVTREELDDNQYAEIIMQRTEALAFSMRTTREVVGANVYNRAFSVIQLGGDGLPLLSAAHPTDNGVQSNILATPSDLNETAIEDLVIQIQLGRDSRGLQVNYLPQKLIVAPANGFNAERILNSVLQNDTANNAVNALRSRGSIPSGFSTNVYLTDPTAWFIRTSAPSGMCWFDRKATEFAEDNDFPTDNAMYKSYMRFVPGWSNFRGLYGSPGD